MIDTRLRVLTGFYPGLPEFTNAMQLTDFKQIKVADNVYYEHSNICEVLGITRQTSHAWRTKQVVPQGRKLRGKLLLFTADELQKFIAYAERIEPADVTVAPNQMKLALKP